MSKERSSIPSSQRWLNEINAVRSMAVGEEDTKTQPLVRLYEASIADIRQAALKLSYRTVVEETSPPGVMDGLMAVGIIKTETVLNSIRLTETSLEEMKQSLLSRFSKEDRKRFRSIYRQFEKQAFQSYERSRRAKFSYETRKNPDLLHQLDLTPAMKGKKVTINLIDSSEESKDHLYLNGLTISKKYAEKIEAQRAPVTTGDIMEALVSNQPIRGMGPALAQCVGPLRDEIKLVLSEKQAVAAFNASHSLPATLKEPLKLRFNNLLKTAAVALTRMFNFPL